MTWRQAGEIYRLAKDFTRDHLGSIKDSRLACHINDSARSVQRNIEECYKRATTREYIQFLGFSRASLEELKGDFEELKREYEGGIRGYKGIEGSNKGPGADDGDARSGRGAMAMIRALLDMIYGQDCMMGRQIRSLENKMVAEKTVPRNEVIKKAWRRVGSAEKRFWALSEKIYGIKRDEKVLYNPL